MKLEDQIKYYIEKESIRVLNDKIQRIYEQSQKLVPVDTGFLKGGWFKRTLELNNKRYVTEFGYGAFYAKFVDLGTVKMEARNYFTEVVKKEFGI